MDKKSQAVLGSSAPEKTAVAACFEILAAQHARRGSLNGLLPTLSDDLLLAELEKTSRESPPLVAYVDDVPYACAFPSVEAYGPDDDGLAYFQRLTGVARGLGVRDGSANGHAALASLTNGLARFWRRRGALGAKVLWPASDFGIARELSGAGFIPDAYVEYRPHSVSLSHRHHEDLQLRVARREDLSGALNINSMILDEHVKVSPFARHVPGVDERFTARFLAATSDVPSPHTMVFVAEYQGHTIGMAECEVERHAASLDAPFPDGTLGYIHAFGVEQHMRRRGVGTALALFALKQLHMRHASGTRLLVSHYNEPSRAFWSRIGFKQVWQLFQVHSL
jgi:ribosomal protein S18 acetylase RimI-like enzyme